MLHRTILTLSIAAWTAALYHGDWIAICSIPILVGYACGLKAAV